LSPERITASPLRRIRMAGSAFPSRPIRRQDNVRSLAVNPILLAPGRDGWRSPGRRDPGWRVAANRVRTTRARETARSPPGRPSRRSRERVRRCSCREGPYCGRPRRPAPPRVPVKTGEIQGIYRDGWRRRIAAPPRPWRAGISPRCPRSPSPRKNNCLHSATSGARRYLRYAICRRRTRIILACTEAPASSQAITVPQSSLMSGSWWRNLPSERGG
jgi:hypothetical protein